MSLMCDEKIFPLLPVKKELKVVISGIYIMGVKGLHSSLEKPAKKKGFLRKMQDKARKTLEEQQTQEASDSKKKKKK